MIGARSAHGDPRQPGEMAPGRRRDALRTSCQPNSAQASSD